MTATPRPGAADRGCHHGSASTIARTQAVDSRSAVHGDRHQHRGPRTCAARAKHRQRGPALPGAAV